MRIFIDMDGTLAQWNNVRYEQLFEEGYYKNLKPERLVFDVRELIKNGAPVYILSCYLKDSRYALDEKRDWLKKWLPELPEDRYIFVPDGDNKAEYLAKNYQPVTGEDILIDDYTKNLQEWEHYGGTGIKYLNGINHTKGTWQGYMVNGLAAISGLKETLSRILDTFTYKNSFEREVDDVLIGTFPSYRVLKVCDTPQILMDAGCEQLPVLYTQKHLKNAIKPIDEKEHRHGLSIEQIKMLPELLAEPVMIYDSLKADSKSIVVVTDETDIKGSPVVVSIKPNGMGFYEIKSMKSNFITSVYGRNKFFNQFERVLREDRLIFFDKKKSQDIFVNRAEQYCELTANLDFNTIIHQSRNIVNGKNQISQDTDLINLLDSITCPEQTPVHDEAIHTEKEVNVKTDKKGKIAGKEMRK